MALGHERDGEVEAIFIVAQCLKLLAYDHPTDQVLANAARKARLQAIMMMAQDRQALSKGDCSIVQDRLEDCVRCERETGGRACVKAGKYVGCRWMQPRNFAKVADRILGPDAMELIRKYIPREVET